MKSGCKHCGKGFTHHGESATCPDKSGMAYEIFTPMDNLEEEVRTQGQRQIEAIKHLALEVFSTGKKHEGEMRETNKLLKEILEELKTANERTRPHR